MLLVCKLRQFCVDNVVSLDIPTGEEEGRLAGLSSMDSRRRISGPILSSANFSKQKSPVAQESAVSKEALVCIYFCQHLNFHLFPCWL